MVATDAALAALEDQAVIARAADVGFRLVHADTGGGSRCWEWRRGSEPRPQFTNRRVAVHWMVELLSHEHGIPFVSDAGKSYS
jgi:hypothetical protein